MDVIEQLLEIGGAPQLARLDSRGDSPLHVACRVGRADVAKFYLKQRPDIALAQKSGHLVKFPTQTPLQTACRYGHLDVIRLLLEKGGVEQLSKRDIRIPFHIACRIGHMGMVNMLLEYGGDKQLYMEDMQGYLPVHVLMKKVNPVIFENSPYVAHPQEREDLLQLLVNIMTEDRVRYKELLFNKRLLLQEGSWQVDPSKALMLLVSEELISEELIPPLLPADQGQELLRRIKDERHFKRVKSAASARVH